VAIDDLGELMRRHRSWWVGLCLILTLSLAASLAAPARASAQSGEGGDHPVVYSGALAFLYATLFPDTPPAGANDWSCRPSAEHPNPVVLVHGTVENMTYNWYTLSPLLANAGYCVFALNYGQQPGTAHIGLPGSSTPGGTKPVAESAPELAAFVDRVLAATGAAEVDIVGHSQGGMMPRYYTKFLGGAAKVDKLVGLAPSNHGTTFNGLNNLPGVPELTAAGLGQSVIDQQPNSEFLTNLNAGGDTVPGVTYTVIVTRYDEVVTPPSSSFLDGPAVTNIEIQDRCPLDTSEHLAISFDANALRYVLNALDPAHAVAPTCTPTLPLNGG
jgi:triacylglycerol esterase/lipase EstA (alpha/beta hydrolase family)